MRKKKILIEGVRKLTDNVVIFKDEKVLHDLKGKWASFFSAKAPLVLEVGMGTGGFLKQLIAYNESSEISRNYIGMEIKEARVARAYQGNLESITAGILKFIIGWASNLDTFFDKAEVSEIYLNFSDPWPREKQENKRLLAPSFLDKYKLILNKSGRLFVKTDNQKLFEYGIEHLLANGWEILERSDDLHASDFLIKSFVTEFEEKYISSGKPIYYLQAKVARG